MYSLTVLFWAHIPISLKASVNVKTIWVLYFLCSKDGRKRKNLSNATWSSVLLIEPNEQHLQVFTYFLPWTLETYDKILLWDAKPSWKWERSWHSLLFLHNKGIRSHSKPLNFGNGKGAFAPFSCFNIASLICCQEASLLPVQQCSQITDAYNIFCKLGNTPKSMSTSSLTAHSSCLQEPYLKATWWREGGLEMVLDSSSATDIMFKNPILA